MVEKSIDNRTIMEIIQKYVEKVCENYKIEAIILFGSYAKGTEQEDSDIDIAIIVKDKLDSATEDALSDVIVDLNLKYDKVFSIVDIQDEELKRWGNVLPFFKNVAKDGVVLWKAA